MKLTVTRFAGFYLAALVIALVLGSVDYELAKRTGHACLSLPILSYLDGGSTESIGFGYTLMYRHKIHHREAGITYYLEGPELKAWNIFNILGARELFKREYGDVVYYTDKDQTNKIVQSSIAGDMIGQKIILALSDLFPLGILLSFFALWTRVRKKERIPTADTTAPSDGRLQTADDSDISGQPQLSSVE